MTAFAVAPTVAHAQDFGILGSAETINQGNVKLRVSPLLVFGKHAEDDEPSGAILLGYGVRSNFAVEGGLAFYDGVTFWGGNAKVRLVKERPFTVSIAGGLHGRTGDRTRNLVGLDVIFLASRLVTPRLELYGGVDLAFEGVGASSAPLSSPSVFPDSDDFKTVHLVPGMQFRITGNLAFAAEMGVALNDSARHYIAGGLAFSVR